MSVLTSIYVQRLAHHDQEGAMSIEDPVQMIEYLLTTMVVRKASESETWEEDSAGASFAR